MGDDCQIYIYIYISEIVLDSAIILFGARHTSFSWKYPASTAVGKPRNGSEMKTQPLLLGKLCGQSLQDGHSELRGFLATSSVIILVGDDLFG